MKGGRDEGGHLWMQETYDQNAIVRNYTKWDHKLAYQDNPGTITSRALQVARTEPCGPVYLCFPKELVMMPLKGAKFPSADQLGIARAAAPDPGAVEEIAQRLVRAKHPVVVVASSGRNPTTVPALVALCELLGVAVVESVQRAYMCFPFRHPLFQAQSTLKEADVVLVVEADVPWVPGRNSPPDSAWVAAVGHDPIKLRIPTYEFTADVRLTADPLATIQALARVAQERLTADDRARIADRTGRLRDATRARIAAADDEAKAGAKKTPIDPLWLSYNVGQLVEDNCVVMDDTLPGNRLRDFLPCTAPGSYFGNPGSSGGWAIGARRGCRRG